MSDEITRKRFDAFSLTDDEITRIVLGATLMRGSELPEGEASRLVSTVKMFAVLGSLAREAIDGRIMAAISTDGDLDFTEATDAYLQSSGSGCCEMFEKLFSEVAN